MRQMVTNQKFVEKAFLSLNWEVSVFVDPKAATEYDLLLIRWVFLNSLCQGSWPFVVRRILLLEPIKIEPE